MHRLILLLCAALALPVAQAEPAADKDDFNPYADAYVQQRQAPADRKVEPRILSGRDTLQDHQNMLEDGYDLLGYSSFEAGSVPVEQLAAQARAVRADVTLIYTRGKGRVKDADRLPKDADATLYDYFASYWTKLPPPLLGLHVQQNNQTEEGGLEVIAVIRESPAAQAGIQSGDILLQLGGVRMDKPEQMVETAQRLAGQKVEVDFVHEGEQRHQSLQLNPPR